MGEPVLGDDPLALGALARARTPEDPDHGHVDLRGGALGEKVSIEANSVLEVNWNCLRFELKLRGKWFGNGKHDSAPTNNFIDNAPIYRKHYYSPSTVKPVIFRFKVTDLYNCAFNITPL